MDRELHQRAAQRGHAAGFVEGAQAAQERQRLVPVGRGVDRIACLGHPVAQRPAQALGVFYDQELHSGHGFVM